jgi:hypothetical protein
MAAVTWNPADKAAGVTLAVGNLDATAIAHANVRATLSRGAGRWYFEAQASCDPFGAYTSVGLASSIASLTTTLGQDAESWALFANQTAGNGTLFHNAAPTVFPTVIYTGGWYGFLYDGTAGNFEIFDITGSLGSVSGVAGTLFPICGGIATGQETLANFGASPFAYAIPAGALAWDTPAIPPGASSAFFGLM